jgi:hypothetical protein
MAKNAEFKDDGSRCHQCKGPGWMQRYYIVTPETSEIVKFHPTCIGGFLMGNPNTAVQFCQGEAK